MCSWKLRPVGGARIQLSGNATYRELLVGSRVPAPSESALHRIHTLDAAIFVLPYRILVGIKLAPNYAWFYCLPNCGLKYWRYHARPKNCFGHDCIRLRQPRVCAATSIRVAARYSGIGPARSCQLPWRQKLWIARRDDPCGD